MDRGPRSARQHWHLDQLIAHAPLPETPPLRDDRDPARAAPQVSATGGAKRGYRVDRFLERDPLGEVMSAYDLRIGRRVALVRAAPAGAEQLVRAAQLYARLDHPAIPPVHGVGKDAEGRPYLAMKRVVGTTLDAMIARGDAGRRRMLHAFVEVCRAVAHAHERGVAHGALAPSHVTLGAYGEVYVLGWTAARAAGDGDAPGDARALARILAAIVAGTEAQTPAPELDALAAGAHDATAGELADRVQRYLDGDRDLARRRALAASGYPRPARSSRPAIPRTAPPPCAPRRTRSHSIPTPRMPSRPRRS